jgi:hypothetical protein
MKNLLFLLLAFLFILACTKKDPCEGVSCLNGGTCVDGTCNCTTGYEGSLCEKESVPSAIKITGIKFIKIPAKKSNGSNWDTDNTTPDIQPSLYTLKSDNKTLDVALWTSTFVLLNAKLDGSQELSVILPELKINPVNKLYAMALFDKDDNTSEFMGAVSFNLIDIISGRPAVVKLDCSTCSIAFEFKLSYEF